MRLFLLLFEVQAHGDVMHVLGGQGSGSRVTAGIECAWVLKPDPQELRYITLGCRYNTIEI
jgi:hypothetical protein